MPCVRGNQLTIEQRRAQQRLAREEARAEQEAQLASPHRRYWDSLVDRIYAHPGGFDALSKGDRLYYLIYWLSCEVHNGGFDQFFSNTSGGRYNETVAALAEAGDQETLRLLQEAKAALFGEADVPVEQATRCRLMPTALEDHPRYEAVHRALDELDQRFWEGAGRLNALLEGMVVAYGLYAGV